MSRHTFFFYGSLMDVEMLEAVIDRASDHLSFTTAALGGYIAETAHGYTFPTLVPQAGGLVSGIVTHGLTDDDVERIAYFEDTEYAPVGIEVSSGPARLAVRTFMATASLRSSGEAWDFDLWRRHHKPVLVAVTRRVMREHFGITPFAEIDAHWHRIKAEVEAALQRPQDE